MRLLDEVFAWTLVVLGALHCVVTFVSYFGWRLSTVWFFGSGVALILGGLINVIRVRVGKAAIVRFSSILANVLLAAIAAVVAAFMWRPLRSNPQVPILLIATFGELLFSMRRSR